MHDRRVAFLFGAGTSSAILVPSGVGDATVPLIPAMDALTRTCAEAIGRLGSPFQTAWEELRRQSEVDGYSGTVERILSKVRLKIDAMAEGDTLVGLDRKQLGHVEALICQTIASAVSPDEATIPLDTPHDGLASWVQRANRNTPIEIFTTNYDCLIERSCENARVPVFDGFVGTRDPFFYPECLDDDAELPRARWVRLWKLHGSVNWLTKSVGGRKRIVRTVPSASGELIFPSDRKYDESRQLPYIAYMDRLARLLGSEHMILVTSGYSFGDEHINAIIFGALDSQPTANVVALMYDAANVGGALVSEATKRSNLTVIARNGGVVAGQWGEWRLLQPIDKRTHAFMDIAFDSDAVEESEESGDVNGSGLGGAMRLGDFNRLSMLLATMAPDVT